MPRAKTANPRMRAQALQKKRQSRAVSTGLQNASSPSVSRPGPSPASVSTSAATPFPMSLSTGLLHLERGETTSAISSLRQATIENATSREASDALARALLETGDPAAAEAELRRGLTACPPSFERRMNLAQLAFDTSEAISHLEHGLLELAAMSCAENEKRVLRTRANCALAETLLTAAENGKEEEAGIMDARCEQAVMAAIADAGAGEPAEIEAQLCLANLRLSQGRMDDARAAMRAVWNTLANPLHTIAESVRNGEEARCSEDTVHALMALPEAHVRIAVGKQFIETALWSFGIRVLESVLLECDFNVEVWFMLALCYLRNGKVSDARDAITCLTEAKESPDGFDGTLDDSFLEELVKEIEEEEKKIGGALDQDNEMDDS